MLTRLIGTADVAEGEGKAIHLPGVEALAVFKVEGAYFCVQDCCTHGKASLAEGWTEGFEVCCPVHDGRFDLRDGRPLCFPVTEAIRTFPCEVQAGEVWADLSGAGAD